MSKILFACHPGKEEHIVLMFAADSIPDGEKVQKGDPLFVDTRFGRAYAKAVTGVITVDDADLKVVGQLARATFPLRQVLGRARIEAWQVNYPAPADELPEDPNLTIEEAREIVIPSGFFSEGYTIGRVARNPRNRDFLGSLTGEHTLLAQAAEMVIDDSIPKPSI